MNDTDVNRPIYAFKWIVFTKSYTLTNKLRSKSDGNGFHFWYETTFFLLIHRHLKSSYGAAHLARKAFANNINNNQSLRLFENICEYTLM